MSSDRYIYYLKIIYIRLQYSTYIIYKLSNIYLYE